MGRKITSADYRRILNDVHKKKPEAALGADLIVGFPGETEEDFQRMVDFLEDAPLTYLHVFSYSVRPGTPAFRWKQIDEKVKKERAARLRALSCRKNMDFRKKWIGVVWDGVVVKRVEGKAFVLTSNFIEVQVPARSAEIRKRVRVKIVDAQEKITRGEIVELPR
jgi:threonylcarbamoyladenosine tRNA methylthiotransferase MtaB